METLDAVHALMVEQLVEELRSQPGTIFVEVPVSHFGWRWVMDIVRFRPRPVCGCHVEPFEVETRLTDVNAIIRRMHQNAAIYPQYLRSTKDLDPANVRSWLVLLATRENAEVLADHANTFAQAFNGHRCPEGSRSALFIMDPLAPRRPRFLQIERLLRAGCLESTLDQLCRYEDKLDFQRQWRRCRQQSEN